MVYVLLWCIMEYLHREKIISTAVTSSDEQLKRIRNALLLLLEDKNEMSLDEQEDYLLLCLAKTMKSNPQRIALYLENIASKYNDFEFQENFRLSRDAFHFTLNKVNEVFNGSEDPIKLEKELLAAIWLLAAPDSYRSVGSRIGKAKSSLSRSFFKIIDALCQIAPTIIKWPSENQMNISKRYFHGNYGYAFINVIGAIDGTYVPVKVPKNQSRVYTNRKKFTGITLQVVCNEQLLFLDCFTGYPSSVNDIRVFRNSDLYARAQAAPHIYFPNGEMLLGDKAYNPPPPWLKIPYINRGNLNNEQINFNRNHSSARSLVEQSFAHFFGRFRRLQDLNMNRLDLVPSTIIAACVLHNICLLFTNNIEFYINEGYGAAINNALIHDQVPNE